MACCLKFINTSHKYKEIMLIQTRGLLVTDRKTAFQGRVV